MLILESPGDQPSDGVTGTAPQMPAPRAGEREGERRPGNAGGGAQEASVQRAVVRAVRAYVEAVDAREADRVCRLLAPGAIAELELPRTRGGCADSLSASIGYRDPRGFPVFDGTRIEAIERVAVRGGEARVTATVVTRFADREEPSVEDDLIYLAERGGKWLIAQPSAVLYRAVGKPEVPPRAVTPPG